MKYTIEEIKRIISEKLPETRVIPRHNDTSHWYEVNDNDPNNTSHESPYGSVTGKIGIIKDEGLMNYKMNRALDYVFSHFPEFKEENILQHLENARKMSADILTDAGDIGSRIHEYRENYFKDWMKTGVRPKDILSYIPQDKYDIRAVSALRALSRFIDENDYIPVATELYVYNHKLKVAGTLDDLGIMRIVVREGDPHCTHESMIEQANGKHTCVQCGYRWKYQFVLMDLKTSNQFKDHYFFQVAIYYKFFYEITGLRPERAFILKVSKEDGRYKIEDLKRPSMIANYARSLIRTNSGIGFIGSLRKDNQRTVASLDDLKED